MIKNRYGYTGKILWVNLSDKTINEEEPDEEIYRQYLGGYGLGIYYIYTHIKPKCDPLGPDNILGFCPGLFTGNPAPFTGRYMVCGKSPLTGKGTLENGESSLGGWGDANSGGYFGPAIKKAGYDAIFITGISENPVYLYIDDEKKEILDASELWSKDIVESDKILKSKHGNGINTALIGVGGENKILFSGIVNDNGRIAARSGLGAVMGSKRLKGLCLNGKAKLQVADRQKSIDLAKQYRENLDKYLNNKIGKMMLSMAPSITGLMRTMGMGLNATGNTPKIAAALYSQFFHKYGTPYFTGLCSELGDTPIKNYQGSIKDFPKKTVNELNYTHFMEFKEKPFGCFGCPVQCGAILNVPTLPYEEKSSHRPEYETIAAFGGLILNNDADSIIKINEYLNREGVDSISAGGTVAFAIECAERGLLKQEDFKCEEFPDGFLPKFGESEYILPLLKLIVNREGIGDILANGSKEASKKIPGSEGFAITANGEELPMHDGRFMEGLLLNYLADPTPGRHTAGSAEFLLMGGVNIFVQEIKFKNSKDVIKRGITQAKAAKFAQSFNSLGFCQFSVWCGEYPLWKMINTIFGWDITPEEFLEIGWRIQTLRQMFNAREGAIRHEIPGRAIGDPPLSEGPLKNRSIDLEPMIQAYYENIGFAPNGVPLEDTLKQLGLDFAIKDLSIASGRPTTIKNTQIN